MAGPLTTADIVRARACLLPSPEEFEVGLTQQCASENDGPLTNGHDFRTLRPNLMATIDGATVG